MQRYLVREGSKQEMFMYSAFTTPAAKGYVYIEADKEAHVKNVINGIRALKWWKIALVPISEMVDAINVSVQSASIKLKQWVRLKTGIYKHDLAQVIDIADQGAQVTVKLVPRLDYAGYAEAARTGTKKRKRTTVRPLARLFDKEKLNEYGVEVTRKANSNIDMLGPQMFRHGFLIKKMNSSRLILDGAEPTMAEIEIFQTRLNYDDETDDSEIEIKESDVNNKTKELNFVKDDRVIVVSGDLKNLTGRVTKCYGKTVTVIADREGLVRIVAIVF